MSPTRENQIQLKSTQIKTIAESLPMKHHRELNNIMGKIHSEYLTRPDFPFYNVNLLPYFDEEILPTLLKAETVPLLIKEILEGNSLALNMYNALYHHLGREDLIIGHNTIYNSQDLSDRFINLGADIDAFTQLTAERWLFSDIAAQYLSGITNEDLN